MSKGSSGNTLLFFAAEVNGENVKAISAALHFLQKVGKDMSLEAESGALTLRALNDTKSAFAAVELRADFFVSLAVDASLPTFACSVAIKPLCAIFRNAKSIQWLRIAAAKQGADHELSFQLMSHSDITRSYRFLYSDCDVVNAVFDEEAEGCSAVRAKPKVFTQLLAHIHQSPEVCIEASAAAFAVRSYHQTLGGGGGGNAAAAAAAAAGIGGGRGALRRHVNTGLSVSLQEFDRYDFRGGGGSGSEDCSEEIVFCAKELVAFLGFSESIDAPDFDFFFTEATRAVKLHAAHDLLALDATLVLATIEPPPALASMDDMMAAEQRPHQKQKQQQQQQQQQQRPAAVSRDAGACSEEEEDDDEAVVVQRKRKRGSATAVHVHDDT